MIEFRIMLLHVCGIFAEQDYHLMKIHTLSMYSALSILYNTCNTKILYVFLMSLTHFPPKAAVLCEVTRIGLQLPGGRSRSPKVADFHTDQKPVCDFPLAKY